MITWIKNRIKEMTTWNGTALIAVGCVILFAGAFVEYAAYAAIVYGAWSIWKAN
jgi:hypothetical protein|tara:strand:+ start:772 stop:933 length:162 start_codon:yes stop_codon:yes gene_type:complete